MYLIVDYDWNTRHPKEFYSFKEAKENFIELSKDNDNLTLEKYTKSYNRIFIMGKEYNKLMRKKNARRN
jgi:hypothetical protein